jgi:hypothetical protein
MNKTKEHILLNKKLWSSPEWKESTLMQRGIWASLMAKASLARCEGIVPLEEAAEIVPKTLLNAPCRLFRPVSKGIQLNTFKRFEEASEEQAEAIYQAYPKRLQKKVAIAAIKAQLTQYDAEMILEKTKLWAKAREGHPACYTPYPATWFNQQRFLEDASEWVFEEKEDEEKKKAEEMKKIFNI